MSNDTISHIEKFTEWLAVLSAGTKNEDVGRRKHLLRTRVTSSQLVDW